MLKLEVINDYLIILFKGSGINKCRIKIEKRIIRFRNGEDSLKKFIILIPFRLSFGLL